VELNVEQLMSQLGDTVTVKRVFGEPYEKDGVTFIPVARIGGGGGGGGGSGEGDGGDGGSGSGYGLGLGLSIEPAGAYVISGGSVRWQPATDPSRLILRLAPIILAAMWRLMRARRG
jgi:uncharacterized spore protein YtfJ